MRRIDEMRGLSSTPEQERPPSAGVRADRTTTQATINWQTVEKAGLTIIHA